MTETLRTTPAVPLFDRLPKGLKDEGLSIKLSYDATMDQYGIVITLDARTGTPVRARLTDLLNRNHVITYSPLERAKWASPKDPSHDVKPGTRLFEKLEAAEEYTRQSLELWKKENPNRPPQREYTNTHRNPYAVSTEPDSKITYSDRNPAEKLKLRKVRAAISRTQPEKITLKPSIDRSDPISVYDESIERILRDPKLRNLLGFD